MNHQGKGFTRLLVGNMKQVLVLALALGGASAFAPVHRPTFFHGSIAKTARFAEEAAAAAPAAEVEEAAEEDAPPPPPPPPKMSQALPFMECPEACDGTMAGDVGFDPLGFSKWIDIRWLREAEIKHGRLCQLAIVGFAATDLGIRLPGEIHQVSSILAHDVALKYGAMQQLFLWISIFEIVSMVGVNQMINENSGRVPGDFGLDPLNFCSTPEKTADYKLKEITHCRLAMFAFSGMVTQAVLTQSPFPYMS